MKTYDFSRSFLTFEVDFEKQPPVTLSHKAPFSFNRARIALESTCELTNRRDGSVKSYVLIASCKTEQVGTDRDLFTQPNADFCAVVSPDEFLILKSWQSNQVQVMRVPESLGPQPRRQVGDSRVAWTSLKIEPRAVEGRELRTVDQIIRATLDNARLTARTEYDQGDYHVRLDYPVKTINTNERNGVFQTDTGPIAVPDLSPQRLAQAERLVAVFDLAYSAFNCPGWIEFILNVPTPVGDGITVNHYSQRRRIDNTLNTILAVEPA